MRFSFLRRVGRSHRWVVIWMGAALMLLAVGLASPAVADVQTELDQRIALLIAQLGDNEYSVRQRAQQELQQLGFAAFDALTDAEESPDVEIAAQARYLSRVIRSDWINDRVPPEINAILKNYEGQSEAIRLEKMQQLLQLPADAGIEWLCRLMRFEQSPVLAKQVALKIITQDPQPDDANWPNRAAILTKNLERSRRPAALWLRTYVEMRSDPDKALKDWIALVETEKRTLEQHPQQSDSSVLLQLLRIEVAQLERLHRDDEVLRAMHEMVAVERGESQTLAELVSWLAKRHAWTVIDEVATRFASSFEADPQLLYTLAQALAAEGKTKEAEETVDRAIKLNPEQASEHFILAQALQRRSLLDWSDREYRQAFSIPSAPLNMILIARAHLAESLHDRGRDREAAEVRQGFLTLIDGNRDLTRRAKGSFDDEAWRARMNYCLACDVGKKNDFVKQRELLETGIQIDPYDADILIALYRLPDQTPQQRETTKELIDSAAQHFRNQVDEEPDKATSYNQLAWLMGNTERDADEAVRLSEKSIELIAVQINLLQSHVDGSAQLVEKLRDLNESLGGSYDTLAHCYAGKGDYAAAVAKQTEARRLIPYSRQIADKLEFFQSKVPPAQPKVSS
jgi:tetratricopeptide (TPR) repeat protein